MRPQSAGCGRSSTTTALRHPLAVKPGGVPAGRLQARVVGFAVVVVGVADGAIDGHREIAEGGGVEPRADRRGGDAVRGLARAGARIVEPPREPRRPGFEADRVFEKFGDEADGEAGGAAAPSLGERAVIAAR